MTHAKSILAAIALCLTASSASHAQTTFRIGPSVGWLHNMPSGQDTGNGLSAGAVAEADFSNDGSGWFADAGAAFEKKKWNNYGYFDTYYPGQPDGTPATDEAWHYTTYGLKFTVAAGYKLRLSNAVKLYGAVGPYLNIGLSGKCLHNMYTPANGQYLEKKVSDNVYKDGLMNRATWGIGAKVGAEQFRNYRVTVAYDHGMSDVFKQSSTNTRHRTLSVGVGYMF